LRSSKPFGDLLAGLVARIEIMVAGTDQEPGSRAQPAEIFPDHDALRSTVNERTDVEMISGHHDHVEIAGNLEDPVEQRKRMMEVGYQEEAHGTV
jgi:hypothetical protein